MKGAYSESNWSDVSPYRVIHALIRNLWSACIVVSYRRCGVFRTDPSASSRIEKVRVSPYLGRGENLCLKSVRFEKKTETHVVQSTIGKDSVHSV
jgi:hypothetical protein